MSEKEIEIARLRAAEKFMKKETGDAVCSTCGYTYEMAKGTPAYDAAALEQRACVRCPVGMPRRRLRLYAAPPPPPTTATHHRHPPLGATRPLGAQAPA